MAQYGNIRLADNSAHRSLHEFISIGLNAPMWWYITEEWSYDVVYGINVYMRAETATGPSAINEAKYVGNWSQTLGQRQTANITLEYWHRCLEHTARNNCRAGMVVTS